MGDECLPPATDRTLFERRAEIILLSRIQVYKRSRPCPENKQYTAIQAMSATITLDTTSCLGILYNIPCAIAVFRLRPAVPAPVLRFASRTQ